MILTRTVPLLAVLALLAGLPAAATAAPMPQNEVADTPSADDSNADDTFAALSRRFRNLFESLRNTGGMDDGSRPFVEQLRARYAEAADRWPGDPRGWAGVLQLSMWLDDAASVEQAFERLVAAKPDDEGLRLSLANYHKSKNRFDRALEIIEAMSIDPTENPQAVLLLSELLFAEGRYAESIEALDRLPEDVLATNPLVQSQVTALRPLREECVELWAKEEEIRAAEASADDLPRVQIDLADGSIVLELFENEAPNTVANFISLAESDFYDGTRFHRVIPSFMAQGGDPNSKEGATGSPGLGDPGYKIRDEHTQDDRRNHFTGSLAMAKTSAPDTAGCQFYITHLSTPNLNGRHTVFGRVISGLDVARAIEIDDEIVDVVVIRKRDHEYVPETISAAAPTPVPAPPPTSPPLGTTTPPAGR